jgi:hypothetical protein
MTREHDRNYKDHVKVVFALESGAWHGSATETLWAERVGDRRLRLRNVPFFAFGVSVEDVVTAKPHKGIWEFESVSLRGGHSSYRVITTASDTTDAFHQNWQELERLGCTYEQGPGNLRAIDVPPNADIHKVYAILEQGERDGIWKFEEGHCGHAVSG